MKKHQRGAAVLVAILIVTLAASTAAFAVWQQSLWVRQLENINDRARADQLAAGGIDVARDELKKDKRNFDSLNEYWATPVKLPADNAEVSGFLTDQQGLFNVNNLIDNRPPGGGGTGNPSGTPGTGAPSGGVSAADVDIFKRLLKNLDIPNEDELTNALVDWIDEDSNTTFPGGAEDMEYLSEDPPYTAFNKEMVDIGELAYVKGFTEDVIEKLKPYVTALPTRTAINVNTASAPVLAALVPGWSVSAAEAVIKNRGVKPFENINDFRSQLPQNTPPLQNADIKSNYFLATVKVHAGRIESGYTALLDRGAGGWPSIKWRKDAAD